MHKFRGTSSQHFRQRILTAAALCCALLFPSFAHAQGKYEPRGDAVYHGAGLPDYWNEDGLRRQVQNYRRLSGKNLAILTWFASMFENGNATSWSKEYAKSLRCVKNVGGVSLIKFSTCDSAYKSTRRMASPPDIARGGHDAYFTEFADAVRDFGDPVFISLNHEMNGDWYPYSSEYPGTRYTAADYVAMWRRIVNIFRQRGADNVAWVWSPNVPDVGRIPAAAYYPGDNYVDWVGASFYSGNTIDKMESLYRRYAARKPFFVTEWATAPEQSRFNSAFPGDARWVADFFQGLQQRYPRVKAISWFQWNGADGNFRLERVPAQQKAYAQGVRHARYIGDASGITRSNPTYPPVRHASLPARSAPVQKTSAPLAVASTPSRYSRRGRIQLTVASRHNIPIQR